MRTVKPLLVSASLALMIGGCGSSDDQVVANGVPAAEGVATTTIPGCPTTTTLNTGEGDDPWRGTAPPWVPRGEGDMPVKPVPTLPEGEVASGAEVAFADDRIGPILADAELIKAFPWNVFVKSDSMATSSVGSLLYFRLREPTDVPLDWGHPVAAGSESGWLQGEDGLPVLEPSEQEVFSSASVVAVYVRGSASVYMVMAYDYMPLPAC